MSDSFWLRNDPCPKCRENGGDRRGDNLGVFSDGHLYCWKCGFHKRGHGNNNLIPLAPGRAVGNFRLRLSEYFEKEPLDWLLKYGLSFSEITTFFRWDNEKKWLVFILQGMPIIARTFNPEDNRKYYMLQKQNVIVGLQQYPFLVFVEDMVSAIKVGRQFPTCPLFGVNITDMYPVERGLLWLDYNMSGHMMKIAKRSEAWRMKVTPIITELDPKEYSDEEIKQYVLGVK